MRDWTWTEKEDGMETDAEGNLIRMHYFVFAGPPRPPGSPSDLTWLKRVETPTLGGQFSYQYFIATPEEPDAEGTDVESQELLISTYNATVEESWQLNPGPVDA